MLTALMRVTSKYILLDKLDIVIGYENSGVFQDFFTTLLIELAANQSFK
jgi:hypothetical protein